MPLNFVLKGGRHAELLETKGLYYAMWRQQVGEMRESRPVVAVLS